MRPMFFGLWIFDDLLIDQAAPPPSISSSSTTDGVEFSDDLLVALALSTEVSRTAILPKHWLIRW